MITVQYLELCLQKVTNKQAQVVICENEPSAEFDNTGFPLVSIPGCEYPEDGILYLTVSGIEKMVDRSCRAEHNKLREQLLASTNIWTAIGHLTEFTGMECGRHLETLLCKEIGKERDEEAKRHAP